MDNRPRQKDFERIGKEGCYFLSIIRAAELIIGEYIDAYQTYVGALEDKVIESNCFVNSPAALLSSLTGMRWSVRKETREYVQKPGEVVILRFERQDGMTTKGHFVLAGDDGSVEYDPYGVSETVASGSLVSKRVFSAS